MKKLALLLLTTIFMTSSAFAFGVEKLITFETLPQPAQETIKTAFNKKDVAVVKQEEIVFVHMEYKVIFKNGMKVEFDKFGQWQEVKGAVDGVPAKLVPQKIADYVKDNYQEAKIIEIERKDQNGFEIKLSNKFELSFDGIGNVTDIERDND